MYACTVRTLQRRRVTHGDARRRSTYLDNFLNKLGARSRVNNIASPPRSPYSDIHRVITIFRLMNIVAWSRNTLVSRRGSHTSAILL